MKTLMRLTVITVALFTALTSAFAESPREQLTQMVEQLQKSPGDNALREKIIRLAQELKPAPAVPEEAERRMMRGTAALEGVKSVADYQNAAKEFEQATLAAPWYGDAYFNLGVAQDKAENYEAALRSLKFALLASPNDKEIQALIFKVEYRNEKTNSPEAQAAKQKQQEQEARRAEEEMIRGLEGAIFVENMDKSPGSEEWKSIWKDSHFLRIQGGRVEEVDRQTDSALKLGDGIKKIFAIPALLILRQLVRKRCAFVVAHSQDGLPRGVQPMLKLRYQRMVA
jgi:tetratricopeptide (TPR) repeat protein